MMFAASTIAVPMVASKVAVFNFTVFSLVNDSSANYKEGNNRENWSECHPPYDFLNNRQYRFSKSRAMSQPSRSFRS
jgi:hypothetical protein